MIKIFDPSDKPFGPLSNDYKHSMQLDGREWRTVSNYVYANMLRDPVPAEGIRVAKTKDLRAIFKRQLQQETDNEMRRATETALRAKFGDKDLTAKLLATEDSRIIYVSQNPLLGIGSDGKGENMYGEYLMHIRRLARVSSNRQEDEAAKSKRDRVIYDTYLAGTGLLDKIRKGDDLEGFLGKLPTEIVEAIGRAGLEKRSPDRDTIMGLAKKGSLPPEVMQAIDSPETLVQAIRKKEMRGLRLRGINERKAIILRAYIDDILKKNYPELTAEQRQEARKQELARMSRGEKIGLEVRLFNLFERDRDGPPDPLLDAVKEHLERVTVPSEDAVKEAERFLPSPRGSTAPAPLRPTRGVGPPVLVYSEDCPQMDKKYRKYLPFSPTAVKMLNVDGKLFPTVTHYIVAKMTASIRDESGPLGMKKAYLSLLADPSKPVTGPGSFVPLEPMTDQYFRTRDHHYGENLRRYARRAMDKKFEDRLLQDILLASGGDKLVYNDFGDGVLGVGAAAAGRGADFAGKYLMELRTKYRGLRGQEMSRRLRPADVPLVLSEDPFMKEWIKMRVTDVCRVLMVMKDHVRARDGVGAVVDAAFTGAVLDEIYRPCSRAFATARGLVAARAPHHFKLLVQGCPGFKEVPNDVVEAIWGRLSVMVYYLIEHLRGPNILDLRAAVGRAEVLGSRGGRCVGIVPDERDNCIVSALLNLLGGIVGFNRRSGYKTEVTERDIEAAISIILGPAASAPSRLGGAAKDTRRRAAPEEGAVVVEEDGAAMGDQDVEYVGDGDEGEETPEELDEEAEADPEGKEVDYNDAVSEGGLSDEQYSPRRSFLVESLAKIDGVRDAAALAPAVDDAVETIKRHPMPKQAKFNRVNFFATRRA